MISKAREEADSSARRAQPERFEWRFCRHFTHSLRPCRQCRPVSASTLLIQQAEVDWAFTEGKPAPFKKERPMKLLTGDFDVFGDGSATLLSTPGHTPGHQSLLVHLGNTGWVLLTGDAAHFKDNWDNDRVPSINSSAEQTHASHALLAKIIAEKKAALWINHDLPTFDSLKHSPEFYD